MTDPRTTPETPTQAHQRDPAWPHCGVHQQDDAVSRCTRCGAMMCLTCHRFDAQGLAECTACHLSQLQSEREEGLEAEDLSPVAWEDQQTEMPLHERFFTTVREVLLNPQGFFARLKHSQFWFQPLVFGYLCMVIGTGALVIFQLLFPSGEPDEALLKLAEENNISIQILEMMRVLVVPIAAGIQLVLELLLLHAATRLVGGKGSFLKTLQLNSYSAASYLFCLVPVLGFFLTIVSRTFVLFAALRDLHELSFGRSALAICIVMSVFALGAGAL